MQSVPKRRSVRTYSHQLGRNGRCLCGILALSDRLCVVRLLDQWGSQEIVELFLDHGASHGFTDEVYDMSAALIQHVSTYPTQLCACTPDLSSRSSPGRPVSPVCSSPLSPSQAYRHYRWMVTRGEWDRSVAHEFRVKRNADEAKEALLTDKLKYFRQHRRLPLIEVLV